MGYSDMNLECFRPPTLLKKEILAQVFPCEFCEISKNTFFTEHLRWLLLECGFYWLDTSGKKSIRLSDEKDITRSQCDALLQVRYKAAKLQIRTREKIKDPEGKGHVHYFEGQRKRKLFKLIRTHGWIHNRIFECCLLYNYKKILNGIKLLLSCGIIVCKFQKQPSEVFCKKGVFKNFAKLTGKHLCKESFLIEL